MRTASILLSSRIVADPIVTVTCAFLGIDHLFAATYCAEEFGFIPKWQIYQQVAPQHAYPQVMVGDRFHDIEVATRAGIPSIGCAYGYGDPSELEAATITVDSPAQIVQALETIQKTVPFVEQF